MLRQRQECRQNRRRLVDAPTAILHRRRLVLRRLRRWPRRPWRRLDAILGHDDGGRRGWREVCGRTVAGALRGASQAQAPEGRHLMVSALRLAQRRVVGAHVVRGHGAVAVDGRLEHRGFGFPAKLGDLVHGGEGRDLGRLGGCLSHRRGQYVD